MRHHRKVDHDYTDVRWNMYGMGNIMFWKKRFWIFQWWKLGSSLETRMKRVNSRMWLNLLLSQIPSTTLSVDLFEMISQNRTWKWFYSTYMTIMSLSLLSSHPLPLSLRSLVLDCCRIEPLHATKVVLNDSHYSRERLKCTVNQVGNLHQIIKCIIYGKNICDSHL